MAEDRTVYKLEGDATGLIRSLGGASRALDTTAKKADKTDKEIKQLGDQSKKTATKTKGLAGSLKKMNVSMKGVATGAGMLAGALLAAGAAAGQFLQSMADSQNELSDLSSRTGVATKTLAGLRLAAKGSGQDFKAISSALKPLVLRLGQAGQGSKTAVEGFKAVGVEVLDAEGNLRSADDVLLEITSNLNDMEDPTKRAASAALAFGSAGTKLVQALGGQDLQVFSDAAERFGMDTGPRAAKAADDWQRAMANLELVMQPFTTGILEWAVKQVNNFALGWTYISTLLSELSTNILPNIGNAILLVFADMNIRAADTAKDIVDVFMGALEGFAKAYAYYTGDQGPLQAIEKVRKAQDGAAESIRTYWTDMKEGIATTSTLADAYKKAYEEAQALYDLQNAANRQETGVPSGGGGGDDDTGEDKKDKEKECPECPEDKEDELSTLMKMADVTKTLGDNMNDLTDPAGVFRDIMGEVTDALVSIDEIDFEQPGANLEKFGIIARGMGEIFGSVIKGIMKSNDELTKKQKTTLKVLFALQKASGITSIIIDTAIAATKALAVLGPIAGPIAAGIITVQGAVQAGMVASQKPPFHIGGIIPSKHPKSPLHREVADLRGRLESSDQGAVSISALPGESVLTREATAELGAEGVAALNSGQKVGQSIVVEMVYKHRIFDNFVQDNISKGGPLRSAIKSGRCVGHRSRG